MCHADGVIRGRRYNLAGDVVDADARLCGYGCRRAVVGECRSAEVGDAAFNLLDIDGECRAGADSYDEVVANGRVECQRCRVAHSRYDSQRIDHVGGKHGVAAVSEAHFGAFAALANGNVACIVDHDGKLCCFALFDNVKKFAPFVGVAVCRAAACGHGHDAVEFVHAVECQIVCACRNRCFGVDGFDAGAVAERLLSDICYGGGDVQLGQRYAVLEGSVTDSVNARREFNRLECPTVVEGVSADGAFVGSGIGLC